MEKDQTVSLSVFELSTRLITPVHDFADDQEAEDPFETELDTLISKVADLPSTSEGFLSNVLIYISGFIVKRLAHRLHCSTCKEALVSSQAPH